MRVSKVQSKSDEHWMGLALRVGRAGRPSPNPHVGAVLVRDGKRLATGYHRRAGQPHAEVMAIRKAGDGCCGATLYVTLEPCHHHGRTGPCTEAIVRAGIKRVVVGCADPRPHVPGALSYLRAAGVVVDEGVCESRARDLVADFAKFRNRRLPYVISKQAVTLDGRIASRSGSSRWITGAESRREVHRMRSMCDAVMVGSGTVRSDDPALTVREGFRGMPLRVVLDGRLSLGPEAKLLQGPGGPVLIFHGGRVVKSRAEALVAAGAELVEVPDESPRGRLSLQRVLEELAQRNVVRLLCEGGTALQTSLWDEGRVDEVRLFFGDKVLVDARSRPMLASATERELDQAIGFFRGRWTHCGADGLFTGVLRDPSVFWRTTA